MEETLSSIATNYFASLTLPLVVNSFKKLFRIKSALEQKLKELDLNSTNDGENFIKDVKDAIYADAGTESIELDNAFVTALDKLRFNHAHGTVDIKHSRILNMISVRTGENGNFIYTVEIAFYMINLD